MNYNYQESEEMYQVVAEHDDLPYQTKLDLWNTAFGLQDVDGLRPSKYLRDLAEANTQGKIGYQEIQTSLSRYYSDTDVSDEKKADLVSLRIVAVLADPTFSLHPLQLLQIYRSLFTGVFHESNISKNEPVLGRASVNYASHELIEATLNYDFEQEKRFDYRKFSSNERVEHLMDFFSSLWQIHPFREGNTRTIAVFAIKYLRGLGFSVNNEPFEKHAQFFRDALVLKETLDLNYQNGEPLWQFFENLLLEGSNELASLR